jgi:hypothetical protein
LKTLAPNTFHLTKGHHHHIQDKIKTNVLNATHPIGNPTISARKKSFFHCEIDKSGNDKDEEAWDISSSMKKQIMETQEIPMS